MKYIILILILLSFETSAQQAQRIIVSQTPVNTKNPPNSLVWADTSDFYRFYSSTFNSFPIVLTIGSYANPSWITSLDYSKLTGTPTIPAAQVNTDWNAVSGVAQLLNKPILSTVALSGAFSDLIGKPTTLTGYGITDAYPLTGNPSGFLTTVSFGSLTGKPTTLSGYGITDAYPLSGNPAGFLTGITSGQVTTALGFTPVTNTRTISINGTSQDLSTNRTWTGIGIELPTQTGNSGKMLTTDGTNPSWTTAAAGTVTSVGIASSDFAISGSPITGSGNITANLNMSGVTAGTYATVTVNNKGIVTAGLNPLPDSLSASRSFNTSYQMSTTKYVVVNPCARITCALSLTGGQEGSVTMQISPDNATWTSVGQLYNSNTGTLTIGLNTSASSGGQLTAMLPPGYYWRLVTNNVTGTPTYTMMIGNKTTY